MKAFHRLPTEKRLPVPGSREASESLPPKHRRLELPETQTPVSVCVKATWRRRHNAC